MYYSMQEMCLFSWGIKRILSYTKWVRCSLKEVKSHVNTEIQAGSEGASKGS